MSDIDDDREMIGPEPRPGDGEEFRWGMLRHSSDIFEAVRLRRFPKEDTPRKHRIGLYSEERLARAAAAEDFAATLRGYLGTDQSRTFVCEV